jgi:hypothetical protein
VGIGRGTPYRDSNRVCRFQATDRRASVIPSGNPLAENQATAARPGQKQRNVPVWAILGQYSSRSSGRLMNHATLPSRGHRRCGSSRRDVFWELISRTKESEPPCAR